MPRYFSLAREDQGADSPRRAEFVSSMSRLRELVPGQTPNVSHVLPVLDLRTERRDFGDAEDHFITHVDGFLEVETPGVYGFRLVSDDGSRLYVDDRLVVDNDGLHGPAEGRGAIALAGGRHALRVEWFNRSGGATLALRWGLQGENLSLIPAERFRHEP